MKSFRSLLTTAVLLCCHGCAEAHRVQIMTVLTNGNCKTTTTGVRLIDYAALAELRGTRLIGMEAPEAAQASLRLIAIVPGEYPTAGYHLTLDHTSVDLADPLTLHVTVAKPPPDAILAQVITHPCLVVGIENAEVKRVRVIDDAGHPVGEVDVSKSQ